MIDFRILELLASKICHDIISPVGAINNGVELIEDIGGSVMDEAIKLISNSGIQAAKKLRLFRMAYGKAGAEGGVTIKDIRTTAKDYLSQGKSELDWPEEQGLAELAEHKGGLKTLLCTLMLAEDVLSHGGKISVETMATGDSFSVMVGVNGRPAQLSEAMREALALNVAVDDISPRTVHAYVLGQTAEHYGLKITHNQISEEKLSLMLMPRTLAA